MELNNLINANLPQEMQNFYQCSQDFSEHRFQNLDNFSNFTKICTPFSYPNDEQINVFLDQNSKVISDLGKTYQWLEENYFFKNKFSESKSFTRHNYFIKITLINYNTSFDDNKNFFIKYNTEKDIVRKIAQLCQTIIIISNVFIYYS